MGPHEGLSFVISGKCPEEPFGGHSGHFDILYFLVGTPRTDMRQSYRCSDGKQFYSAAPGCAPHCTSRHPTAPLTAAAQYSSSAGAEKHTNVQAKKGKKVQRCCLTTPGRSWAVLGVLLAAWGTSSAIKAFFFTNNMMFTNPCSQHTAHNTQRCNQTGSCFRSLTADQSTDLALFIAHRHCKSLFHSCISVIKICNKDMQSGCAIKIWTALRSYFKGVEIS